MKFFEPIRNFYEKFERPISSVALLGGFALDVFTLRRVDALFENLWMGSLLLLVGTLLILVQIEENKKKDEEDVSRTHFWYTNALQFFFGGVFSGYLVFYFRSSDLFTAWPFLVLLLVAFLGNEFLKKQFARFSFQIGLFFLSIYLYVIFILPVYLHRVGDFVFLLSGAVSLGIMFGTPSFFFQ